MDLFEYPTCEDCDIARVEDDFLCLLWPGVLRSSIAAAAAAAAAIVDIPIAVVVSDHRVILVRVHKIDDYLDVCCSYCCCFCCCCCCCCFISKSVSWPFLCVLRAYNNSFVIRSDCCTIRMAMGDCGSRTVVYQIDDIRTAGESQGRFH